MKKISLAIILVFSALACAQTTTTVTGTIKDLSSAVVTSGQVTFTLKPGADTTISGTARFSPSTVTCAINGSGLVKAADGLSVCTLVNNTALTPAGTYYQVCIQPQFVTPGSCFNWYALGTSTDITTVVPTPGTAPAFTFVDTYSNQTVAGNKTFTGTTTFSGSFGVGALTASSLGINALGTATSGANFNSGNAVWSASIWNGSIATPDAFTWKNVAGTGSNPSVAWTLTHSGSSGAASVNFGGIKLVNSNINGFFYVDGVNYTTLQQAVTAACATSPVSPVILPPGTYPLNTALTWCTGLNIFGSGSGQADAATCPTTITTTLTSGDLFYANTQNDIHMSNLCIKDTAAAGANAAIRITAGQRNVFEHIYISGPFLRGIQLDSSSTATASTIWNEFSDIHTTGLAANGIGCLLDSGNTANKPINGNKFWNVRCSGGTGGFGLKLTNSVQLQQINDNIIWCTECIAATGTGIQIDQGSTRGLLLLAPDSEGSTNGFVKQTANTVTVLTGNISSNVANVTDAQAIFSSFINGNVGGTVQTLAFTPAGGVYADGYSMGGGTPSSNAINGAAGWTGKVGGTTLFTANTTSLESAQPLKLNEVAAPSCSASNDFLWGDSTDHILKTCQNNGPAQGLAPRVHVLGCNGTATAGTTITMAWPGYATTACTNTTTTIQVPATSKGIAKNLRVRCGTGGANASSGAFVLVDGGGNTTLTCTVGTGTTCSDTTHTPSIAAGDLLLVQFTTQGGETLANCAASFEIQ